MTKRGKGTRPTWTSEVLRVLREQDDFMDYRALMRATGATVAQISATCHHLRDRRAIDCVVEPDGVAWWYATPETDTRMYVVDERVPESDARRRRSGYHVGPRRGDVPRQRVKKRAA